MSVFCQQSVSAEAMMSFEDEYLDVLQNIEFAIISVYRQDKSLLDYDVMDAVEAPVRRYSAEQTGRNPPAPRLHERAQRVYEAACSMCEFRLGREHLTGVESEEETAGNENRERGAFRKLKDRLGLVKGGQGISGRNKEAPPVEAISVEEIVQCLKRIQTSVRRWNKQGGRQGYLNFVSEFIR